MVTLRQGKAVERTLREAGFPASVTQRDSDGEFICEFWADTENADGAPTLPAGRWARRLLMAFAGITITRTQDSYAHWRGVNEDYVLCACVCFAGIPIPEKRGIE